MLLKEIKLLEVDDSITDNIDNTISSFKTGFDGMSRGRGAPKDVPAKFKSIFADKIFTYRFDGQPPYKRAEVVAGLKDDDVDELGETLIGTQASLQQALGAFLREFTREKLDKLTSDAGVMLASSIIGDSSSWKNYVSKALALPKTDSFFIEIDSERKAELEQAFSAHKQQMLLELGRVSSATAFAKSQAKKIESMIEDKSIKDSSIKALKALELNIAMFHIFSNNCTDMLDVLTKSEPKKTPT